MNEILNMLKESLDLLDMTDNPCDNCNIVLSCSHCKCKDWEQRYKALLSKAKIIKFIDCVKKQVKQ